MKPRFALVGALLGLSALSVGLVSAASTIVVTPPVNSQGWSTADTRPGGDVTFVFDSTAPGGSALQLTTDSTNAAKAQYMHDANVPLANVTQLSYWTKQQNPPAGFAQGDPSYQLPVCLGGGSGTSCVGFTTFVFEPYENTSQGAVVPGTWQSWDVDAGQLWSSKTVTVGTCSVTAGAGGPPFYTLAGLKAMCPDAVVVGFGVNVGSYNPDYVTETDLVSFNGTVYDFQIPPADKDQCKSGGWQSVKRANGTSFKNQGDCIQYVNTGK